MGAATDSFGAAMVGAAIGSGNPLLALAAPLLQPRRIMQAAQTIENLSAGQAGRVGNAVARTMRAVRDTSVAAVRTVPVVGAAAKVYNQRSKRVAELAQQRQQVRSQLERETAWMATNAPRARESAINTTLRQLDYLNRHMPTGLAAPTPFAPALPPSRQQMQQWLSRFRAVQNPLSLLDDLAANKLTPEAVDAVRTVYPETYADIAGKVMDRLTKLDAKGERPSYANRIQLGLLLDMPTDPLMAPQVMQAVQGQYASQPDAVRQGQAPQAPRRKAPNIAKGYRSGSEETEATTERQT
jgi:hypothetical protein